MTGTKRHKRHRTDRTAEFWAVLERRHGLTRDQQTTQPLPGLSQLTAADGTEEPPLPTTTPED